MKRVILACLWIVTAAIVSATPPRIVSYNDQLVAANSESIFVIRSLRDNSGSHYIDRRDEYLVELSYPHGALKDIWLMRSTIHNMIDGFPGVVTEQKRDDQHSNPYLILAQKQAAPIETYAPYDGLGYKIKNGALITNYADPTGNHGAKTLMSEAELLSGAKRAHNPLLETFLPLSEAEIMDMSGETLWAHPVDTIGACAVDAYGPVMGGTSYENARIPLLIACARDKNEPEMDRVSFFVFAPVWWYEGTQ